MRARPVLLALPLLLMLAGCAPDAAATPSPRPTTASPAPTPTRTATAQPSSTPSPSADEGSAVPAPPAAPFSSAELVSLCVAQTQELSPGAVYHPEQATTEWLGEAETWFVVVPKDLDGAPSVAVCGIGGTPAQPDVQMHGETLPGGEGELRTELLDGHEHSD